MKKILGGLLITLMLLSLFPANVSAAGDVITDIRFGRSDWANNFKTYHPVYASGSYGYNMQGGSYSKITLIESSNDVNHYYVKYNYDLRRYRLAIAKGDISIDVYTDSSAWHDSQVGDDAWERPFFQINYGYTDDRHDLHQVFGQHSGKDSSKAFTWSETLPTNVRYVMINFDTSYQDNGGHGFAARYRNPFLYFEDKVAPRVKSMNTNPDRAVKIGEMVYVDLFFDEAVTVDSNSTIKTNIINKYGNYVYANFHSQQENSNDYRVTYSYVVQEGDYIPSEYPSSYLHVDLVANPPSGIRDLAGNAYYGNTPGTQTFRHNLKVDGCYPRVNIAMPPVNGYQTSYSTAVTVTEDFPGAGLPASFKYIFSTNSSIDKTDPIWNDSNSYTLFNNGDTISTPNGWEGTYYLHIGAWDNVGNTIVQSTGPINLDATPPTVEFSTNGSETLAPTHEVVVNVSDEVGGSGIDSDADFKYIWSTDESIPVDSLLWDTNFDGTFKDELIVTPPSNLVGSYYLHVKFWDGANEAVGRTTGTFAIDSKAPGVVFAPNGHGEVRADYLVDIAVSDDNQIVTKKYQWKKSTDPTDPSSFIVWATTESAITIQASETGVVEAGNYVLVTEVIDEFGNGTGDYVESPIFNIDSNVETITVSSTPANDGTYNKTYEIFIDTIGYEDIIHYQWTDSSIAPATDDENWIEVTGSAINYGQDLNGEKYLHMKAISDGIDYVSYKTFLLDNTNPAIEAFNPNEILIPAKDVSSDIAVTDNILGRDITLYSKWVLVSDLGPDSQIWDSEVTWYDGVEIAANTATIDGVNGEYILFIKAVDEAGNEDISHSGVFKIDNTAPTGTIDITTDISKNGYATVNLDNVIDNLSENDNLLYVYSLDGGLNFSKTWIPVSAGFEFRLPGNEPNQQIDLHMKFMDQAGNISQEIDTLKDITFDPDEVFTYIEYSTTDFTASDVTAYLRMNGEGVCDIINNNGSDQYVFTDNGTFYFETRDQNGIITRTKAIVYNIDKEVLDPRIDYSIEELTNQDVTVTFTPREVIAITPPADPAVTNTGVNTYDISTNGTYTFSLVDSLGNTKDIEIVIDNIDKTPPTLDVALSNTDPTSQPVEATLSADEEIVVINNLGSKKRIFRESGTYEFIVRDLAGNEARATAIVNNIDTTPPDVAVSYSTTAWTSNNVTATISSLEPITILNNGGSPSYTFNSNGLFYFKVSDALGNITNVPVRVSNIDKNPPTIEFAGNDRLVFIQNGEYDFDDDIVTDDVSSNLNASINFTGFNIAQTGDYQITYLVSDEAGNNTSVTRDVTVISADDYRVFVNGKDVTSGGKVMLYEGNINLGVFNASGDVDIKWKADRVVRGLMKIGCSSIELTEGTVEEVLIKNGYILEADGSISVSNGGWYTFYIQDQERNTEYFYVYIASME